jgi:hypothetical protein
LSRTSELWPRRVHKPREKAPRDEKIHSLRITLRYAAKHFILGILNEDTPCSVTVLENEGGSDTSEVPDEFQDEDSQNSVDYKHDLIQTNDFQPQGPNILSEPEPNILRYPTTSPVQTPQQQADTFVACESTLSLLVEVGLGADACPWRKRKARDVGDLSQCLCGIAVSNAGHTDAIQCRRPGCETKWVNKLNKFSCLTLTIFLHSTILPVSVWR